MNCNILYLYIVLTLYIVGGYGTIIMTGSAKIPPKEFINSMSSQYGYVYTSSTFFIPTTAKPTSTTTSLRPLLTPISLKTPPPDTRVKPTPPSDYTRKVTTTTTTTNKVITSLPIVTNSNYSYHFGTSRSSSPPKTIPGKNTNSTVTITNTVTTVITNDPVITTSAIIVTTTVPTIPAITIPVITTTTTSTTTTKPITLELVTDLSQLSSIFKSNTKAVSSSTSSKVPGTTPTKVVTGPITYNGTIPILTSRTYTNKSTKDTKIVPSDAKTVPQNGTTSTESTTTKSVVTTSSKIEVVTTVTMKTTTEPPQTTQPPQENCVQYYGQCGGKGYNGPTCCISGTTCHQYNEYYSQCIPM